MPVKRDPSTLSNYAAWLTRHTTTSLTVDFDSQSLKGRVDYDIVSRTAKESREIVLDTSHLSISSISIGGAKAQWELRDRHPALGTPLHIAVPEGAAEGDVLRLSIELQTTAECTALQWLAPAQTSNKKHPYMFSQCQAIHARSLFPCQDTPDVKSTYTFNITSPLSVIASGILSKETLNTDDVTTTYVFEQKVPIPSYLFALASGDIATAQIGSRSKVATGPEELHDAKWELERDIEKFIEVAEKLVFPYRWGEYNVLVLPPSFPYGGESIERFRCTQGGWMF
ncbi:hypothetical protein IMZ48_28850 [Candidatus Bathyarchaeota archaeon]|nr:hypothetical protein [Candidatus Bathyarchaeota archaeon]